MTEDNRAGLKVEKQDVLDLIARVRSFSRPVASVYATVHPGQAETLTHAVLVRVKNTLRDLEGIPDEVCDRITAYFESRRPTSRSVAVFANQERLESLDLELALLDDAPSDHLDARYGEPYFTPLLSAINEYAAHLAVFTDRDHVWAFRVFLGQAELLLEASRESTAMEQDEIGQSKDRFPRAVTRVPAPSARSSQTVSNQQNKPKYVADRGDAARQLAHERIEHSQASFYREQAQQMQPLLERYGIEHVLILGPERDRHLMTSVMPSLVLRRVRALLPSNEGEIPKAHGVLERVQPKIEELEAARDAQLLDAIADRGVQGIDECLAALQQGRLHQLAVPLPLTRSAYMDPRTEYVSVKQQPAADLTDDAVEPVDLSVKLPELAEKWGAHIEFVSGEQAHRVVEEFGGMGGLARW